MRETCKAQDATPLRALYSPSPSDASLNDSFWFASMDSMTDLSTPLRISSNAARSCITWSVSVSS